MDADIHWQPPPSDLIGQAISDILERLDDWSETNATEYTAESEISQDELLQAALLKRDRNSSQWIYRLPQEIFTEILVIDVLRSGSRIEEPQRRIFYYKGRSIPLPERAPKPPVARRAQLCNVSHRFLQTVMNTPRIWSDICWGRDDYVRLLKMSAQAPLLIQCSETDLRGIKKAGTLGKFLQAVWEHSGRWEALSLNMRTYEGWPFVLEPLAPRLRDLALVAFPRLQPAPIPYIFKISGLPALRNLQLSGVSIQWDSVDLSRLRSLSLSSIQDEALSLEQLSETLRMASTLEELFLHRVNTVVLNTPQQLEPQPIHLNSLITLWIDEMPAGLAHYLITIIRSPRLKTSHVHGLLLEHLENSNSDQNPYHHFFQIIAPTLASQRTCGTLALCNEIYSKTVCLRPEEIQTPWPDAAAAVSTANFGVLAEDPQRAVRMMVRFLTSHRIDTRLTVIANGNRPTTFVPSQTASYFPEDVLGELPGTVTKITASVLADAANILTFLGYIRRDKNTGRLGWACPQLEVLEFRSVQGLTMGEVQRFLARRYSDGNPLLIDGEVVQRPRMVTIEHCPLVED